MEIFLYELSFIRFDPVHFRILQISEAQSITEVVSML